MRTIAAFAAALILISGLCPPAARAVEAPAAKDPQRLALGANYMGTQLRGHISPRWAAEFRFLTGSSSSTQGSVSAIVLGLRGYRFWSERSRIRPYAGLELTYAQTSLKTNSGTSTSSPIKGFGDVSGFVAGGFGGLELRITRRIKLDFDIGPYWMGLKEQSTGVSGSSWDFVANTAVNVYLF